MAAKNRQAEILHTLKKSETPLSGSALAEMFQVSRQIIVSDINKLKKEGHLILSTPRGYMLDSSWVVQKVFKVYHKVEDTRKELYLIVDLGGEVKDVFIFHRVYNEIHAPLNISSRRDADEFCDGIESGSSSPLSTATGGYHYHTITAKDSKTLDLIEKALSDNGFLAPLTDYEPSVLFDTPNDLV